MLRFSFIFLCLFLTACGGSDGVSSPSVSGTSYCGVPAGAQRIAGKVTSVHDGDTITVNGQSIRLGSIDAPELAQTYGSQSRDHLSALVLGQQVTVTYAQKDPYDRVLGTVFTPDCSNVNLSQVASGAAWYYEAYKCEIDIQLRTAYAKAQNTAKALARGLWAAPAMAPWVFRNGVDAKVPASCPNGDGPSG
jgi:endonuclease YncB( thermonuclease family)